MTVSFQRVQSPRDSGRYGPRHRVLPSLFAVYIAAAAARLCSNPALTNP